MLTKEELRGFGQMFSTPDVLAQGVFSVGLAVRDAALLAAAGWPAARTEALRGLLGRLQTEHNAYAAKAGVKKATRAELLEQMFQAKRWKGIAVAIGQNALDDNPAERAKLLEQTMPVRGDAARLLQQIRGLLQVAETNSAAFRTAGASDAFFAEGRAVAVDLEDAMGRKLVTKRALPAEKDMLDELDGQVWYELKALHRSGRAGHLAAGDRGRANEYNLDILYRRRPRRAPVTPEAGPTPPVTPTPA